MRHLIRLLTLAVLLCFWLNVALAQAAKSEDTMRRLLSLPAPTPRTAIDTDRAAPETPRSPQFFAKTNPPADDAPTEDVVAYWTRWVSQADSPVPSDVIRKRLLDACSDHIEQLPQFLKLFPVDEPTAKRIKELFDKATSEQLDNKWWFEEVKKWLVFNSNYFLNDLFALASKVKDAEYGNIANRSALVSLSHFDWQTAEPLNKALATSSQPRSSTLAVALLYRHAVSAKDLDTEEKYRNRLKAIASDRTAPGNARDIAIGALSTTDWSGRDDWYLSLFADDSLRELSDGHSGFSPLKELFDRDLEKWIPVMIRLVESKDRAVQQAAASLLVMHSKDHPRRDVILPVLRWLSDPDWLDFNGTQRSWFIQTLAELDLPESVPGLLWIIENEEENRTEAARTLAHCKDPRVVPVLRKVLAESDDDDRRTILEGLIQAGGLPDSEAIAALEAYITWRETPEGREQLERYRRYDGSLPVQISIATYLANLPNVPVSLARSVLVRAESLKKTSPTMAQSLLAIASKWRNREIDLDIIQRIAAGTAALDTITTALDWRSYLRENLSAELQMLMERSDEPLGFGAVLLNDPQLAEGILTSDKQQAQIALLAGARFTQTPLAVELVGKLLPSKNALLAFAAERYLLAEDSLAARKLLWQHRPDQAFVTGWRENGPFIAAQNLSAMGRQEEKLRAELFKEDGPLQIFGLVPNSDEYSRVLRIYTNKAVFTLYENSARSRERVVSEAELANFKQFIVNAGLSDQGPIFGSCHHECMAVEFVALQKNGAYRVFSHQGFGWITLFANFDVLGRGDGLKFRYELENQIKGLEVLLADDHLKVKDVWQRDDELRVYVEREETEEESKQRKSFEPEDGEEDEAARKERWQKEAALDQQRFSWRKFSGNKVGPVVAEPEIFATPAENKVSFNDDDYLNPLVTPDGKWLVAEKREDDWSEPHFLVRRNLQTGREFRIRLKPADEVSPIAFVPLHNKVLVIRGTYERINSKRVASRPIEIEYYLLDPATGATQLVSGEFDPLYEKGARFLQPTGQPNEFWAAIPYEGNKQTEVGRYNLKDFSFKPVLVVPQINFDSRSMWVDESHDKLYVVYENQLIRLPLKPAGDPPR